MKNGKKRQKWYGGVRGHSDDDGKAAFQAAINGGNAAFNVVYGGGLNSGDGSFPCGCPWIVLHSHRKRWNHRLVL